MDKTTFQELDALRALVVQTNHVEAHEAQQLLNGLFPSMTLLAWMHSAINQGASGYIRSDRVNHLLIAMLGDVTLDQMNGLRDELRAALIDATIDMCRQTAKAVA